MAGKVAVAGGTGGLGRTIVEQILAETDFEVIVLTRNEPPESAHRVQYVQVDYDDVHALSQELENLAVETVICVIGMYGEDRAEAQLNLIKAAKLSSVVGRFIPSEFGYVTIEKYKDVDPGIKWFMKAADLLKASNLTYTRVFVGGFMDFLGIPHVRSNLAPMPIVVDLPRRQACIPGDGNNIMSMSYSYDAATFVAKLLDLDEWPEFSYFAGDDVTCNQMVQIAEEIDGHEFQVTYASVEEVSKGTLSVPEVPKGSHVPPDDLRGLNIIACHIILSGASRLPTKGRLNEKFPDFQPKTIRKLMRSAWGKEAS